MVAKKKVADKTSKMLKIQYYRSAIGTPEAHRLVIKSLGFKRLSQIVSREDSPAIRGMVAQIPHLVRVIEQ